ncbi:MAG: hypothetical protein ACKVT2_17295 [Saprospiraceae bacterium]
MNTKVLLAALAGAVTTFLTGWVLYGMALKGFFEANTTEGGMSVMRGEMPIMWGIFVGCLAWSLLLALLYNRWAGISTFKGGAMAGAWIMFLVALGADFFSYASMNVMTMTAALVDPVVNAIQGAIAGGVIGWVLGYGSK